MEKNDVISNKIWVMTIVTKNLITIRSKKKQIDVKRKD